MMIFNAGILPNYFQIKGYGLLNTRWAMIIPGACSVYNVLITRTYFMNSIPDALQEAATLDGASKLQKVWYITIPVLIPTAVTLFILDVGDMMNLGFEKAYALQNDSNRTTGEILSTYVYEQGIRDGNYSFSTAVSLFNSMINLVLICLVNMISKKVSEISLW